MSAEFDIATETVYLQGLFDRLIPKYRAVLALRYADFTQREAGIILGITRAAVGIIQKKAEKKIRAEFQNDEKEQP